MSDLMTTTEAVEYLKIGRTKLFQLASLGRIRRTRFGRCVRWRRVELDRLVEASTTARRR